MSLQAVLTGIGAVLTAAAGLALIIREFRNREHKAARNEIGHLTNDLYNLDQAYIEFRRYAHTLRQLLADAGIDAPSPPPVHRYEAKDELASGPRRRHVRPVGDADVHDSGDSGGRGTGSGE